MYIGRRKSSVSIISENNKFQPLPIDMLAILEIYKIDSSKYSYRTSGGGFTGQKESLYYAVINLICKLKGRKSLLKEHSKITDTRRVERKKPGRTKARKSQPYLRR